VAVLAAIVAIAAAVGVAVVAAAFALFAVLRDYLGPAGSAAVVAGVAALIVALAGLIMLLSARTPAARRTDDGLFARAVELAREKPLIAVGAAALAAVVIFRNPKLVTAALTAFLAGKAAPKN
jgi:hypothetical protein